MTNSFESLLVKCPHCGKELSEKETRVLIYRGCFLCPDCQVHSEIREFDGYKFK